MAKEGFCSLFDMVFVIAFESGKVLDLKTLCQLIWKRKDKYLKAYKIWKSPHSGHSEANFYGSAGIS